MAAIDRCEISEVLVVIEREQSGQPVLRGDLLLAVADLDRVDRKTSGPARYATGERGTSRYCSASPA